MPFLRQYYFGKVQAGAISGGYSVSKKTVIIGYLARMRIFDEGLYENFATHLGIILSQASIVSSLGSSMTGMKQADSSEATQLLQVEKAVA
jgi:hypothetical protein